MSGLQLFALLNLTTLSGGILILLLVVAFRRDLRLTCGLSVAILVATLAATVCTGRASPLPATPLLQMDGYALLFDGLILLATIAVCLLSFDDLRRRPGRGDEFFILLLLSALGAMVLASSVNFVSFVLGLELLSVSIYTLIAYPMTGTGRVEAATKYLILSGVSSAFLLFGIALVYLVSGTLSFDNLTVSTMVNAAGGREFLLAGLGMILAGFLFKLSLVPFHLWTPDVYEGAPAPVTAFVATVSKGALFVLLLRFFLTTDLWHYHQVLTALSVVAGVSILVGNLLALLQTNVKRLLAYSSIAHVGYLMVIFIAASMAGGRVLAIDASAWYLFAYFITTLGAFAAVAMMSLSREEYDAGDIGEYQGLFWRRPGVAATFTAMLMSLAGIPLTAGFIAKFYVFAAGVNGGLWPLVYSVIIGSGIGLYYYMRIVFTMASRADSHHADVSTPVAGAWVMAALMLALLVFGVYPTPVIGFIDHVIASS